LVFFNRTTNTITDYFTFYRNHASRARDENSSEPVVEDVQGVSRSKLPLSLVYFPLVLVVVCGRGNTFFTYLYLCGRLPHGSNSATGEWEKRDIFLAREREARKRGERENSFG
jgi:hypothetical protein